MRASVETFAACLPEFRRLAPDHYQEAAIFPQIFPCDVDEFRYLALEQVGCLLWVSLRDDRRLVGYLGAFIMPDRYSRGVLTFEGDLVYVLPEYRGRLGFRRLWRVASREARRRGVKVYRFSSPLNSDLSGLLRLLGFTQTGEVFAKTG